MVSHLMLKYIVYVAMQLPYLFVLCHSHKQYTVQVAPSIVCTAGKDDDPHSTEALHHTKLSLPVCLVNTLIYIATEMICITAIDLIVLINCNSVQVSLIALQFSCHHHSHIMQFQLTMQLATTANHSMYAYTNALLILHTRSTDSHHLSDSRDLRYVHKCSQSAVKNMQLLQ